MVSEDVLIPLRSQRQATLSPVPFPISLSPVWFPISCSIPHLPFHSPSPYLPFHSLSPYLPFRSLSSTFTVCLYSSLSSVPFPISRSIPIPILLFPILFHFIPVAVPFPFSIPLPSILHTYRFIIQMFNCSARIQVGSFF